MIYMAVSVGGLDVAPHFGKTNPQKPPFWGNNRHFKHNMQTIKTCILLKLLHQILHSDKDHHILLLDGPNMAQQIAFFVIAVPSFLHGCDATDWTSYPKEHL